MRRVYKIHITSFGCSNNLHEGEIMAGLLEKSGYTITNDKNNADIIILNLCTVKGDHHAIKALKRVQKLYTLKTATDAKIIAAGCIHESTKNDLRKIFPKLSLLNTNNLHRICDVVGAVIDGKVVEALEKPLEKNKIIKINLDKKRINKITSIVPISKGCTSSCAYCSVKLLKGNILSYCVYDIVNEITRCIADGAKEIYLTGQDTGAYGLDWNSNRGNKKINEIKNNKIELPELLDEITRIKGEFMIRVGMSSPNHIYRNLNKLISIYRHPKIYKFLHIPVQSGSNTVLKYMRRPYTIEQYKECVKKFREAFPELTIATDIIIGFSGEREDDFEQTLNLLKETQPDIVNLSRFSSQPGTLAAKMKQVSTNIAKERSKRATMIINNITQKRNLFWKGWSGKILINEYGKNNTIIGRNYAYKQVIVAKNIINWNYGLGDEVNIIVKETAAHDLRCVVPKK